MIEPITKYCPAPEVTRAFIYIKINRVKNKAHDLKSFKYVKEKSHMEVEQDDL